MRAGEGLDGLLAVLNQAADSASRGGESGDVLLKSGAFTSVHRIRDLF